MPAPCAGVLRDDNDHEDEDDEDDKEDEGALVVAAAVAEDEREEEDTAAGVACIEGRRPGTMCFASRFRRDSSSFASLSDRYGNIR